MHGDTLLSINMPIITDMKYLMFSLNLISPIKMFVANCLKRQHEMYKTPIIRRYSFLLKFRPFLYSDHYHKVNKVKTYKVCLSNALYTNSRMSQIKICVGDYLCYKDLQKESETNNLFLTQHALPIFCA